MDVLPDIAPQYFKPGGDASSFIKWSPSEADVPRSLESMRKNLQNPAVGYQGQCVVCKGKNNISPKFKE